MKCYQKHLSNQVIMFYPFSQNQSLHSKAFDFISQKNINETEDFISIDTKNIKNVFKNKREKKLSQSKKKKSKYIKNIFTLNSKI